MISSTHIRPEFSDPAVYETIPEKYRDNHELITCLCVQHKQKRGLPPTLSKDILISLLETVDCLYDETKFPEVLYTYLLTLVGSVRDVLDNLHRVPQERRDMRFWYSPHFEEETWWVHRSKMWFHPLIL